MARIASVVTNGCNPDPRVLREARWLVEMGHEVTIHAFDRLENLPQQESVEGIIIHRHRVGKTPYGATLSTVLGLRKFRKSVQKSLGQIDLLHCHDADTLPLIFDVSAPTLFDMHDLQHTWVLMPNPHSFIRRYFSNLMKKKMLSRAKKVDAIITSSPGFVAWLGENGLHSSPVENRIAKQGKIPMPDTPKIGYFGKIRETSSFTQLRDALLNIKEINQRPSLLIAGDGTHANLVRDIFANTTEINSEFRGPFTHSDFPSLMSEIGLMFALYSPERGNITDGALPAKMFEAAAYGRPTIVNRNTFMGQICEAENLGISVEWGDVESLSKAIIQLIGQEVDISIDERRERERFLAVVNGLIEK